MADTTYSVDEMTETEKRAARAIVEVARGLVAAVCKRTGKTTADQGIRDLAVSLLEQGVEDITRTQDVHPERIRAACCAAMSGAI